MSFIYDILYKENYPFDVDNCPAGLNSIEDICIINKKDTNEESESSSESGSIEESESSQKSKRAYLTDFIISKDNVLMSIRWDDQILSLQLDRPIQGILYYLTNKIGENIGTVVFSSIPKEQVRIVNVEIPIVDKCIKDIYRVSVNNIFDIADSIVRLNTSGSILSTIQQEENGTAIYFYVDDTFFIPDYSLSAITTGNNFGVLTINGMQPVNGNININIEGYSIKKVGESGFEIYIDNNASLTRCGSNNILSNIKCSTEDGSSTPYPLDQLVCGSSTVVCNPVWEDNE